MATTKQWVWFATLAAVVGVLTPVLRRNFDRFRLQRDKQRKRDIHVWEDEGGRVRDS